MIPLGDALNPLDRAEDNGPSVRIPGDQLDAAITRARSRGDWHDQSRIEERPGHSLPPGSECFPPISPLMAPKPCFAIVRQPLMTSQDAGVSLPRAASPSLIARHRVVKAVVV